MMNPVETLESLYTYFDNLGQGVAVLDREGTLVSLNRTAARLVGLTDPSQAQGRFEELADAFTLFGERIPPPERPSRLALLGRFVRNYEAALWPQGAGEAAFVEISTAPIPDAEGQTAHILVSYREISEQRRLDEARARLAAIVESSEDAIIGKDLDGTVTAWNKGAEKLFGYTAGEMIGQSIRRLLLPGQEAEEDEILGRVGRGETVQHSERKRRKKNGEVIEISVTISPIRNSRGEIVGASKIARDITESLRTSNALRESQQRLTGIIDSAMDAIITVDERQSVVLFNTAAERMFLCSQASALGSSLERFIPQRFRAAHARHIRKFAETGMTSRAMGELGSLWAVRSDGEEFEIEASISQVESHGHKLYTVILRDVNDRKQAEDKMRRQAEELARSQRELEEKTLMLQSVLDSMSEGLVAVDEQGRFILWNPAAEKIVGMGPAEVAAESWNQHYGVFMEDGMTQLPPEQNPLMIATKGQTNSALIFVRNSRIPLGAYLEIVASPLRDKDGVLRGGVTAFRDVTERRRAQENARQLEERFTKAFKSSPIAISVSTVKEGRYVEVNDAFRRMLGYVEGEVVGRTETELNVWALVEQRAAVMEKLRQSGTIQSFETQFRTKSGGLRSVNLAIEAITLDGEDCMLTTMFDVTETRNLERQLAQSQKMEAVGQLTGGIAHDFNNLLGVITGNLDLLERQVAWNEAAVKRVQTALRAAGRGAELTRRLLAFSRREHLTPSPVAIDGAIREMVELSRRTMGPEIRIATRCDADLPPVFVDAAGLETALLNLALNARDAMPKGGSLIFSAHLADLTGSNPLVQAGELAPGKYARVAVSDSGSGMSRETLDRAFEPFFTTKPRDKGTGLGLAMVYGFIKQSGGAIRLYSEVGYGTTVSIYLPLAEQPAADEASALAPAPARADERLGGTALVVDDEADLLDIADAYLAELGYTVIRAEDAAAALAVLERAPEIDLLLTDVIMPGELNGFELAERVRRMHPEIKIIFTSGFPAEALAERSGKLDGGPLLHKPYLRAEFADMVRKSMCANSTAHPTANRGKPQSGQP
jgi:PAS domain S-box-containing protein